MIRSQAEHLGLLPRNSEEEAEGLLLVGGCVADREGKVEGERSWAESGDVDAEASTGGNSEGIFEGGSLFDRPKVTEHDSLHHVVSGKREEVLHRIDELKATADAPKTPKPQNPKTPTY